MIKIYTDGACYANGEKNAKASWAFIVVKDEKVILEVGGLVDGKQSNNTGELTAIREAMKYLEKEGEEKGLIYSDSKYAINSLTVWNIETKVKGRQKKNYELIKEIKFMMLNKEIRLFWVKGHSENYFNYLADKVATSQLQKQ